jgi:hypothetical protein
MRCAAAAALLLAGCVCAAFGHRACSALASGASGAGRTAAAVHCSCQAATRGAWKLLPELAGGVVGELDNTLCWRYQVGPTEGSSSRQQARAAR